uniref:Uncharacterized protein n=1 Tax=Globisporangium ultimum (strain ATCC 200006 / CBS 805.95 / DAOM BR144) TaxID=431595 RepID=K3WGC9_GLOUD
MASHHSSLIGNAELGHAATAAAAAAANAQETKGQDLQHAVDFYQKGMEIAHNSSTYDDYCRAIEHFSLAIAVRNTQPRFFLARGNAFRSINEYEHAAKDYGMAIALDDRSPLYYANRGGCYRKLNQPIVALEDLTAAIEMDVKKGNHYFNRALVLYEAGFYREAIIDFSRTLEEGAVGGIGSRIEYRALQSRGNCYRRLGNLAKCIDDLENAIKIDSRNSTGFNYLAQAYYERGDYDRAIEQCTHAIEFNNVNASYYSHRGLCYYRKGEDFARNCLADFNHSIKLDGKDPQAYFYRGSMRLWLVLDLLAANAAAQAQQQAHTSGASSTSASGRSAITTAPSGTPTTSTVAQSAAKSSVAPTLTLSAQDIATEANGGLSMSSLGFLTADEQLEAAFSDIEMAWTLCPTGTQYQIGMAMITQLKKQHREASTLFDEISDLDRTQVVVKYHLALSWHMLDEHEKALVLLTDAIDALPNEPLFFEARGLLLQELQLHPLAIGDFTRAIELNPDNPVNLYLRSESFLRLEKFTDTVADCTSALNRGYTSDLSVYNARGMAYRGLNEYDKALADISVCLSKAPGNDIFHFHRGVCYMECGRYADALPDLHAAVNQNQRDTKYYHIGISYALENCNINAIENFTFALEHSSSLSASEDGHIAETAPPALLSTQLLYVHERAKALQLEKYFEEAIDDFNFVIRHNPNNAHAYFRRGFAHKSLGNLQGAASDFETAKLLDPTNLQLVVNYREIKDTECVVLCAPGEERVF